ncbi:hypothetical protein GDO86_001503 [Hymenochirus boettgeri]|uniref:Hyaluronan/mRNA-binding protein domain-containing protein n=1 Tax=Hymenochirus boettgeri TaxID=247094 RepID=A0A8T2KCZ6_9PIPI|nr:hypothetical protein GDO86_001503 [Hymenochirus boettgeri]
MKQALSSPVSVAMEETFGCAVENRFYQLLDDESDPLDIIYQATEEVSRRKKKDDAAAAKKSVNQKGGKKESQKDRKAIYLGGIPEVPTTQQAGQRNVPKPNEKGSQNENLGTQVKVDRTERRTAFKEVRPNIMPRITEYSIEKPLEVTNRDNQARNWSAGRGGMRGRGRGGFPRNTEGENLRGKREFERHSGSDRSTIRAEDKRGGSGARNWGSIKDVCSDIEPVPLEEHAETIENMEAGEEEQSKAPDEITDGFSQEMTLDEWKCIQHQSRPKQEFNLRKPETSVPSKAVVIHSSKFKNKINENDEDLHYCFRKPVNDITSQLDINFGSLSRPSRGRGGGGRGRNRREESFSPEEVNVHGDAPNPDDPEDFPALA